MQHRDADCIDDHSALCVVFTLFFQIVSALLSFKRLLVRFGYCLKFVLRLLN